MSHANTGITDTGIATALRAAVDTANAHARELRALGYDVDLMTDYPDDESDKVFRVGAIEKTVKVHI